MYVGTNQAHGMKYKWLGEHKNKLKKFRHGLKVTGKRFHGNDLNMKVREIICRRFLEA